MKNGNIKHYYLITMETKSAFLPCIILVYFLIKSPLKIIKRKYEADLNNFHKLQ